MHTVHALRGNARTFLTHLFGSGLEDDRYVIERFKAMVDGNIRRIEPQVPKTRRKAVPVTASLRSVKALRPARNEIIVCTGLRTRGGLQIWGDIATGMFHDRKQKR